MNRFLAAFFSLFVTTLASACSVGQLSLNGPEGPQACPAAPDRSDIVLIDGAECTTPDEVCASTDGCECSVTCRNGFWEATNPELCAKDGGSC